MFDVLIYLFETYIHNEIEIRVDQDKLTRDLTEAGFHRKDIHNALNWLEKLVDYQRRLTNPSLLTSNVRSMRFYTAEECYKLDTQCRSFILFLEQIGVINAEAREIVIERVMALDTLQFDLDDLKLLILMVLFNVPGYENAYQQIEELIFNFDRTTFH